MQFQNIKTVFFDLDRTLWDFEENSHEELIALYRHFKLHNRGISLPEEFIKVYKKINEFCWAQYRENLITKEDLRSKRFSDTLDYFGIEDATLATEIGDAYVNNSPKRTLLVKDSIRVLDYLSKKYEMHIITNGFEEVQHIKIENSGLKPYFNKVITSEQAGVKKPNIEIFNYALSITGASADSSIYIGDDFNTDVLGAVNAGWRSIGYIPSNNEPNNNSDYSIIHSLDEILYLL